MTSFSMPHWSDPVIRAVAEAIYDDASQHTEQQFTRSEAVQCWPGIEARRFVAMMQAYAEATTPANASQPGTERSGVNQTILPQTEKGS
jgi:hypothetical protein